MRPPICKICGKDFGPDDGGLIYFSKTEDDVDWDKIMEEKGMAGHPPYAEWFCKEHYAQAQKLKHLTIGEAVKLLVP